MSSSGFQVIEHTCSCQHVREYPDGAKPGRGGSLKLAVKQYKPLQPSEPPANAVTIIAAHANSFPKEVYEPLREEVLANSKRLGFHIRSIWTADMSHQGASGVMNEDLLGDDPNWFDHSRDLLSMINHFSKQMPRPIIGIGHSLGGAQLAFLSIMHPRLLTSLILIEPMIQKDHPPGANAAMLSTLRKDLWPSRAAAEAELRKNKFFTSWHPRALHNYLTHGLRPTPTAVHPAAPPGSVTLTTTKHQESWSYLRPRFDPLTRSPHHERLLSPDLDPDNQAQYLFHRAEPGIVQEYLPYVRPPVLYLFATNSPISTAEVQDVMLRRTGVGLGGSGGAEAGQVAKIVMPRSGHLVPMEKVAECAEAVSAELGERLGRFEADEAFLRSRLSGKSERAGPVMSKAWRENVRKPADAKRPATRERL